MKNRKLGTVLTILVLSAAAATTGTLAWFTSVRTASITYGDAEIYTNDKSLLVEYKSSLNAEMSDSYDGSTQTLTLSGAIQTTDISGDGLTFYEPKWSQFHNVAQEINDVILGAPGSADGFLVDFTVTLKRSPINGGVEDDPTGLKVFLGPNTKLSPKDPLNSRDVGIIKTLRMAVINYSDGRLATGTPSVTFLYAPEAEASPTYLQVGTGGAYGSDNHEFATGVDLKSAPFTRKNMIAEAEALYPAVADLTGLNVADGEKDVTFRFWVEGTDTDTINDYVLGKYTITLDLYALSEEADN